MLFTVFILFTIIISKDVLALECRFGVTLHHATSHKRKILVDEKSITCRDKDQVCGRISMEVKLKQNVTVHAASCINKTYCAENNIDCDLEYLDEMTSLAVEFRRTYSCKKHKCCDHDNCNVHLNKNSEKKRPKKPKLERLKCYNGIRKHDIEGRLLRHELKETECRYAVGGRKISRQSRCMVAEIISRKISNDSNVVHVPTISRVSHCVYPSLCEKNSKISCANLKAMLSGEKEVVENCTVSCCTGHFCNSAKSITIKWFTARIIAQGMLLFLLLN